MKTFLLLAIMTLFSALNLAAQTINKQVVASAGGTISNTSNKVLFTIGEPVIGKIGGATIINQGFLAAASSDGVLSIEDQLLSAAIKLYPNPVQDNLQIDLSNITGEAKLILYTITGQLIQTKKLSVQNNSMKLSHLQSGVYLVNLYFTDYKTNKTFKIIKK